jgi:transposase
MSSMAQFPQVNRDSKVLHVAFELSAKSWTLASAVRGRKTIRVKKVEARDWQAVRKEFKEAKKRLDLPQDAAVVTCYESGRDGFFIHRWLEGEGIRSLVVDSASIDVKRRLRRRKTDRLDAKKLVQMLMRHEGGEDDVWSVVRVPDLEAEDLRRIQREMGRLKKEASGHRTRILSVLATHGLGGMKIGEAVLKLKNLKSAAGYPLGPHQKAEIAREWERLQLVEKQKRELKQERIRLERESKSEVVRSIVLLTALSGIGAEAAWTLGTEVFGWREFNNRKEVGAATGLTGSPYTSGADDREQGISKTGNKVVRSMLVEISWLWLRYQPSSKITGWFSHKTRGEKSRGRRVAIVGVARKIAIALWHWVEHGVMPEGGRLSRGLPKRVIEELKGRGMLPETEAGAARKTG